MLCYSVVCRCWQFWLGNVWNWNCFISSLSVEDFLCDYFLFEVPIVILLSVNSWPAMRKWHDIADLHRVGGRRNASCGSKFLTIPWTLLTIERLELDGPWSLPTGILTISNSFIHLLSRFEMIIQWAWFVSDPLRCSYDSRIGSSAPTWLDCGCTVLYVIYRFILNLKWLISFSDVSRIASRHCYPKLFGEERGTVSFYLNTFGLVLL